MAVTRIWDADNGEWQLVGSGPGAVHGVARVHSPALTLADSVWTNIPMGSGITPNLTWDTDGFYDPVANTSQFVVPPGLGGYYHITFYAEFGAPLTGNRFLRLQIAGATHNLLSDEIALSFAGRISASIDAQLAAGDVVNFQAFANPTGSVTSVLNDVRTSMMRYEPGGLLPDPSTVYPLGQIGLAENFVTPTTIVVTPTETTIIGSTVTVDVPPGRLIKVTFKAKVTKDATAGRVILVLREGTTNLERMFDDSLAASALAIAQSSAILQPTPGAHTYFVYGVSTVTAATVNVAADTPVRTLVEDIGPA